MKFVIVPVSISPVKVCVQVEEENIMKPFPNETS